MLPANGKRANGMELSERKKEILKSVVDAYIASGEPVGSKFLTTVSQIPLSSATIRNEMSELEEMGYLEQPHTSAGRVPTALGYRTYVNSLMERYRLSLEELSLLNELTAYKMDELGKIMEQASHVISEVTNYPTFAVIKPPESDVNRYETVLIDDHSFLLIMIGANGTVRNRNVRLKSLIDQEALEALRKALNGVLLGTAVSDISLPVVLKFEEALGHLYLEETYGLTNEKKIDNAIGIVANENKYHPIRDYLSACLSHAFHMHPFRVGGVCHFVQNPQDRRG